MQATHPTVRRVRWNPTNDPLVLTGTCREAFTVRDRPAGEKVLYDTGIYIL